MPVINLQVSPGLNRDQKRKIVEQFTQTLVSVGNKRPEHIHITIAEIAEENWGFSGKLTDEWKTGSMSEK
jgi:4-oxalocrotonate tautomerase